MKTTEFKKHFNVAWNIRVKGMENICLHLVGPPGIGKSEIIRTVAEEKARELKKTFIDFSDVSIDKAMEILSNPENYFLFVDMRLHGCDPVDLSGIPRDVAFKSKLALNGHDNRTVMFLPLLMAELLSKCSGVLVIDEFLNEGRPNMIAASFKVVRDYKLGDVALSQNVLVVAASNDTKYSSLANQLPVPLRDRFVFLDAAPPSITEWIEYMSEKYGDQWETRVASFLMTHEDAFLANVEETEETGINEPPATPRGWTQVALAAKLYDDIDEFTEFAIGKVGSSLGQQLSAHLRVQVPKFEEIVKNPKIITSNSEDIEFQYLVIDVIANELNKTPRKAKKIIPVIKEIIDHGDREMIMCLFAYLRSNRRGPVFETIANADKKIYDYLADIAEVAYR